MVAWTAVPMSFENMSLVEGKLKLPMLRGEHSPSVRHFKAMEHLMADDLSNWLCNVYVEVRTLFFFLVQCNNNKMLYFLGQAYFIE